VADGWVVLREFNEEVAARFAAMVLEANGIETRVKADTAGGALPSLAIVFPVRLLVLSEDVELAREVLDAEPDPDNGDPDE
jgi:hypothetical protein